MTNNCIFIDSKVTDDERRRGLYAGQLYVYSPRPSILAFAEFARGMIREAFGKRDPETAQYDMPVIAVAPNNDLVEKLKSNLQEVRARGGELYVFADPDSGIHSSEGVTVITMPKHVSHFQASAVYSIPLQLLAYHCAILRGTDVDQPRNLAKSVTVE